MSAPSPLAIEAQLLRDWAEVGLQRLEAHLARWADFADYLERRPSPSDNPRETS